jgi:hypothetical protein
MAGVSPNPPSEPETTPWCKRKATMSEERKSAGDARIKASEDTLRELRELVAKYAGTDSELRRAGFDDLADRIAALGDNFEGEHIEFGREEHRRQAEDDDAH